MKTLLTHLILLVAANGLVANTDSLWTIWNDPSNADTVRIKAMADIVWDGFLYSDPDSAFVLAGMQLAVAESNQDKRWEAMSLNLLGISKWVKGDLEDAAFFFNESLQLHEQLGDRRSVAKALNNLGMVAYDQGDHQTALDRYQQSLSIKKALGDRSGMSATMNNIGLIYKEQGMHEKAIDLYSKSLAIDEENGDLEASAKALNNIGNLCMDHDDPSKAMEYYNRCLQAYEGTGDERGMAMSLNNIGNAWKDQGDLGRAARKHEEAYSIYKRIGDKHGMSVVLRNIGTDHHDMGELDKALEHYNRSLRLRQEMNDDRGIAGSLNSMAQVYFDKGDLERAVEYGRMAIDKARQVGVATHLRDAADILYKTYKKNGDHLAALEMNELAVMMRDSIRSEDNQREVLRQEYKYSYDRKALADSIEFAKKEQIRTLELEKRDADLTKQRIGLAAAGGGIILLALLVVSIRRGKKRSDELLHNILPEEVAAELKQKGKAQSKRIDQVTVLFTDFKGFTAMAEQLSAQELVDDLNVCFSEFDRITAKYGIEKIKTIGDAYMAAGGLPTPNTTHASDVIKAALEMRDFVEAGKARKIEAGLPYFEIRIGVHTGPVVAGIVGVKKFQYDIWGDTVNTASRMESSGEVGQVNISEATYKLVKDNSEFDFTSRGKIAAKGKGEMEMYFTERL